MCDFFFQKKISCIYFPSLVEHWFFGEDICEKLLLFFTCFWYALVEHFKFFSENIGEKLPLFFTLFSLKKYVKNSELFQCFLIAGWKFWNEIKQYWKRFKFFTSFSVKKSVKDEASFSSTFSLKNLKCSTSVAKINLPQIIILLSPDSMLTGSTTKTRWTIDTSIYWRIDINTA